MEENAHIKYNAAYISMHASVHLLVTRNCLKSSNMPLRQTQKQVGFMPNVTTLDGTFCVYLNGLSGITVPAAVINKLFWQV